MSQWIELEPLKIFLPSLEKLVFREEGVDETRLNEKGLHMPQLLTKAFKKAAQLPEPDQIAFAKFILAELASDLRWQKAFDSSQDVLAQLSDEALAEHRAGRTYEHAPTNSSAQTL